MSLDDNNLTLTTETVEHDLNKGEETIPEENVLALNKEEFLADSQDKVDILFKATGNAPILKKKKWRVEQDKKIGNITGFLRKYLMLEDSECLFLYVNQSFAPSPDQIIRNLYECFGSDGKLVIHYCKNPAWG